MGKRPTPTMEIADAYNHVGDGYGCYADGNWDDDPAMSHVRSAHADSLVWAAICTVIDQLQASGVATLRLLDAGCGPGAWTKRIANRALRQGLKVEAIGFDISSGQLAIACKQADYFCSSFPEDLRPRLQFIEHNLAMPLPWDDGQFHLVLCNFAVLNHLRSTVLPSVVSELCRVSSFRTISTVRALASPPTACIVGLNQACEVHQDSDAGELTVVLKDGTRHRFPFNLYSAEKLKTAFAPFAEVIDIRAVDLFVNRFSSDSNWAANPISSLPGRGDVLATLRELEESFCRLPGWIDHGTHVLIVAEPRASSTRG